MTQEKFKYLFDQHFDQIRNYLYYRSGDKELATDLAQETFLKLWEKLHDLDDRNIKALLYKIANDLFISHTRRQKLAFRFQVRPVVESFNETPEAVLGYQQLVSNYEKALNALPEHQRTVFLMSRMDGLKYFEIADHLGISVKAVEKRMKNALEYLRKAVEM